MNRLTLSLAVVLFTFLVGVVVAVLLTVYPFRSTEKIPAAISAVAEPKVKSNHPGGWKRIHNPKHSQMMLCFPDLGDGTILKFGVHLEDERANPIQPTLHKHISAASNERRSNTARA